MSTLPSITYLYSLTQFENEEYNLGGNLLDGITDLVDELREQLLLLLWSLVQEVKDVAHHLLTHIGNSVVGQPL